MFEAADASSSASDSSDSSSSEKKKKSKKKGKKEKSKKKKKKKKGASKKKAAAEPKAKGKAKAQKETTQEANANCMHFVVCIFLITFMLPGHSTGNQRNFRRRSRAEQKGSSSKSKAGHASIMISNKPCQASIFLHAGLEQGLGQAQGCEEDGQCGSFRVHALWHKFAGLGNLQHTCRSKQLRGDHMLAAAKKDVAEQA